MKFIIRDDDTCAFTDPQELISCYEKIWDTIPINLSVTPFRIPGNDNSLPNQYRGLFKVLPLDSNIELVSFLNEKYSEKKINIAMHGFNHTKPNGLPEYIGEQNLLAKTKQGKDYLENILKCKIDTFVPPNNGIAKKGIQAISSNSMNLVGLPSFIRRTYRPFEVNNLRYYLLIKYYNRLKNMKYPYVVKLKKHKEVNYYSLTPSQNSDYLKESLEKVSKLNGIYILSVHYHAFNRRVKSGESIKHVMNELIDQSLQYKNVQYLTYKQLWEK